MFPWSFHTKAFWIALSIVITIAAGEAAADEESRGRSALLIGVQDYSGTTLNNLAYAESDVEALAATLARGGYDPSRIVVMTNARGRRQAELYPDAARVKKQIEKFVKGRSPDEVVVVVLAGHGFQQRQSEDAYFCPADARLESLETLVSIGDIVRDLKLCKAGHKVLIADVCRIDPRRSPSTAPIRELPSVSQAPLSWRPGTTSVFFSCCPGQAAWEDASVGHGVYMHHLVKGLDGGADRDGDGRVTRDELNRYVHHAVRSHVWGRWKQHQEPFWSTEGNDVVDVPLVIRRPLPKPMLPGISLPRTSPLPTLPGPAAATVPTLEVVYLSPAGCYAGAMVRLQIRLQEKGDAARVVSGRRIDFGIRFDDGTPRHSLGWAFTNAAGEASVDFGLPGQMPANGFSLFADVAARGSEPIVPSSRRFLSRAEH